MVDELLSMKGSCHLTRDAGGCEFSIGGYRLIGMHENHRECRLRVFFSNLVSEVDASFTV